MGYEMPAQRFYGREVNSAESKRNYRALVRVIRLNVRHGLPWSAGKFRYAGWMGKNEAHVHQ